MFRRTFTAILAALAALVSFTLATAEEPKAAGGKEAKAGGEKQITNSIGMKLTLVPSGEFLMGSGESAEEALAYFKRYSRDHRTAGPFKNERPQHRVRITRPYYLGTYHVTRGQFGQFVKESGYKTDAEKGDKPGAYGWDLEKKRLDFNKEFSWRNAGFEQTDEHSVLNVSWNDAAAYCKWLSKKEGKTYRLPTEAEWEYACRAGTTTRYYSGDDPKTLAKVANVADGTGKANVFTAPVGRFKPNAFGLYDMHGNPRQWCADWYGEDYYGESPPDDPKGPNTGRYRVVRGASWSFVPNDFRSAARGWSLPDKGDFITGFRVARTQ